jgi:hypothetical protein
VRVRCRHRILPLALMASSSPSPSGLSGCMRLMRLTGPDPPPPSRARSGRRRLR